MMQEIIKLKHNLIKIRVCEVNILKDELKELIKDAFSNCESIKDVVNLYTEIYRYNQEQMSRMLDVCIDRNETNSN